MGSEDTQEKWAGRVVLVTGAGKGIGRDIAETLAAGGAALAVNDISPVNLDDTVTHIRTAGGQVKAYVEDTAKKMPVQSLLNQVLDDFGRIDILINCTEVQPLRAVLEMDEWDWQRTLDVNLTGAFLLTQSVGRIMNEGNGGVIIHMEGQRMDVQEGRAAYRASKAGLAALVETAALEWAILGIRVHLARTLQETLELCIL